MLDEDPEVGTTRVLVAGMRRPEEWRPGPPLPSPLMSPSRKRGREGRRPRPGGQSVICPRWPPP